MTLPLGDARINGLLAYAVLAKDSILDRLVHNAHRIELAGPSMRKSKNGKSSDHLIKATLNEK